jgi:hypothetical protein
MLKKGSHLLVFGTLVSISILVGSSFLVTATIPNRPPNPPSIDGEINGSISSYYDYTFILTDPDDDILLNLEIDWGDGTEYVDCGCGKTWQNGTILNVTHSFKKQGSYEITARIQDEYGIWSNWSTPYIVSMPRSQNKILNFLLIVRELFSPSFPLVIHW